MKKLVRLALGVGVLSSVLSTKSFATNGDNMMGVSASSRGMGGLGAGICLEPTDSIFRNPGWLGRQKGFNLSFGGILFMPRVKARYQGSAFGDTGYQESDAKTFIIPEVAIANQISNNIVIGFGAYGVSGMGVDYRDKDPRLARMHTNLQFMRLVPAIGYKINNKLAIGGSLHLAWGALDIGARMSADTDGNLSNGTERNWNAGGGQSNAYGIGFSLGVNFKPLPNVCLGAYYQSPLKMKYKNVFDSNGDGVFEDLKLEQPQEIAVGVGFRPIPQFKAGIDVRWINWSDAEGYKDFHWDDQYVIAVGGEYQINDSLALRLGYNYAKTPIKDKDTTTSSNLNNIPNFSQPFGDFDVEWFNLIGFPAITEHHITAGFGYKITQHLRMNFAYVYALEKEVKTKGIKCYANNPASCEQASVSAKNAQHSFAVSFDWNF